MSSPVKKDGKRTDGSAVSGHHWAGGQNGVERPADLSVVHQVGRTGGRTYGQTDRQTDRQIDRQADRQRSDGEL